MRDPLDLLPNRVIRLPLSWIIAAVTVIVSLSVAYGGYKAAYQNQASEIAQSKTEISELHGDVAELRLDIVKLTTVLSDLKDSIEHQR